MDNKTSNKLFPEVQILSGMGQNISLIFRTPAKATKQLKTQLFQTPGTAAATPIVMQEMFPQKLAPRPPKPEPHPHHGDFPSKPQTKPNAGRPKGWSPKTKSQAPSPPQQPNQQPKPTSQEPPPQQPNPQLQPKPHSISQPLVQSETPICPECILPYTASLSPGSMPFSTRQLPGHHHELPQYQPSNTTQQHQQGQRTHDQLQRQQTEARTQDRTPYSLVACGHTFCLPCMHRIARSRPDCPLCAETHGLRVKADRLQGVFLNDVVVDDVLLARKEDDVLCVCWDCASVFVEKDGDTDGLRPANGKRGQENASQGHTGHRWSSLKGKDPHQVKLTCWLLNILQMGSFDLRGTQLVLNAYSDWISECQTELDKLAKVFSEDKICAEGFRADVFEVLLHNRTNDNPIAQTSGMVQSLSRMWSIGVRDIPHHLGFLKNSSVKYSSLVSDGMLESLQQDQQKLCPEGLSELDLDKLGGKREPTVVAPKPVKNIKITQILGPNQRLAEGQKKVNQACDSLGKRHPKNS